MMWQNEDEVKEDLSKEVIFKLKPLRIKGPTIVRANMFQAEGSESAKVWGRQDRWGGREEASVVGECQQAEDWLMS